MRVEDRQEDADARQRRCGQVQFGGRHRLLDETDQPVGRCDDNTGAGRRHPGRVAEEGGVRARGQQPGAAQPPIAVPAAATARLAPTNGRPAGCIGGMVVLASATKSRGA